MSVYVESDDEEEKNQVLGNLEKGTKLKLDHLDPSQHFTQPPAHYTEASLVKALEEQGIGRRPLPLQGDQHGQAEIAAFEFVGVDCPQPHPGKELPARYLSHRSDSFLCTKGGVPLFLWPFRREFPSWKQNRVIIPHLSLLENSYTVFSTDN